MERHKTCSFFGHRNIQITQNLKTELYNLIKMLIEKNNVTTFLFGSRSNFIDLCHQIVTQLKANYPNIKRIAYPCQHEMCILERDKPLWEDTFFKVFKKQIEFNTYEQEVEFKEKYISGKAGYLKRNQAIINASDYCIFYYDKNYLPPKRKASKSAVNTYQPQSGTAIAYNYAIKTQKTTINVFKPI